MDVLKIPFHELLQIKKSGNPSYIFELEEQGAFLNHLGNFHACVQLTLAEASAGEFLLQEFEGVPFPIAPMVRKTEAKYHKPALGLLQSKAAFIAVDKAAFLNDLQTKGRAQLQVKTEIFDATHTKVLTAIFDWFVAKI
jgi:hypothetical protein